MTARCDIDFVPSSTLVVTNYRYPCRDRLTARVSSQHLHNASTKLSSVLDSHITQLPSFPGDRILIIHGTWLALNFILRAIHDKDDEFQGVPPYPFQNLVEIAELAEEYRLVDVLKHRFRILLSSYEDVLGDTGYEGSLAIAWAFRLGGLFECVCDRIHVRIDEAGENLSLSRILPIELKG